MAAPVSGKCGGKETEKDFPVPPMENGKIKFCLVILLLIVNNMATIFVFMLSSREIVIQHRLSIDLNIKMRNMGLLQNLKKGELQPLCNSFFPASLRDFFHGGNIFPRG